MRILLLALLFVACSAELTFSQSEYDNVYGSKEKTGLPLDSVPHKHDMYIHIVALDSNLTALMSIGHFLTDNRFQIAKIDKDFLSINTEFINLEQLAFTVGMQAIVKGSDIKVKILFKSLVGNVPGILNDGKDLEYKEGTFWGNHQTWVDVIRILSKFPHSRIYYSKL